MSGDRNFRAWMRQGLGAKSTMSPDGTAATEVSLRYGAQQDTVALPLWGPGEIAALQPDFVTQMVPAEQSTDATPGSLAWAALSDPYLPWALPFDNVMTPWLTLLCLPADIARIDATAQPGPRLVFEGDVTPYLPEPAVLRALAHTEMHGDMPVATRLLSATRLEPGVGYLCAIVPTSARGRAAGVGEDPSTLKGLAWGDGTVPRSFPAYRYWRFRCGTLPSFEDVVALLTPVPDPGARHAALTSPDTNDILGLTRAETVPMRTVFTKPGAFPQASPALSDALEARLETNPARVEPLGLPAYGRSARRSETVPWFAQVNSDPSLRLAAGMGVRLAADHRDHIADFATEQVGAVDAANALLARARAAMLARRRAWRNMAGPMRDRPAEWLGVVAPALRRTTHDGTSDPDPFQNRLAQTAAAPLADPATRTALRGDMARRAEGRGEAAWAPSSTAPELDNVLLDHIRTTARARVPGGKLLRDTGMAFDGSEKTGPVPNADPLKTLEFMLDGVLPEQQKVSDDLGAGRAAIEADRARDLMATGRRPRLKDTGALAADVYAALDPAKTVPRRIAARIKLHPKMGPFPEDLAQIKWEPPWPKPLVDLLTQLNPDLVAPAARHMKPNDVVLLETDRTMIAAVLVGANHAALADLRWRNFPVRADMSPVRRVFPRVRVAGTAHDAFDAAPIRSWHTTLGANLSGMQGTAEPPRSVLLIRSPIFDMYPETVLYAARAEPRGGELVPSGSSSQHAFPTAFGYLRQGLAYVGFSIDPDGLAGRSGDGWFIVFQGPDDAGGFSLPALGASESWAAMGGAIITGAGLGTTDASAAAQMLLERPLTVALHAARLMETTTP